MRNLTFDVYTRHTLIEFALQDMHLHYDYKKYANKRFDYILCDMILDDMFICLRFQELKHHKLYNNSLNKYLYYVSDNLLLNDAEHIEQRERIQRKLRMHKVDKEEQDADDIVVSRSKDRELIDNCKLYLECIHTHRNYKATDESNDVADDKFLFEKVIKRVAVKLFGEDNITQKIKSREDIGGALWADTVIKLKDNKYLIMDAKFYESNLLDDGNSKDTVYAKTNNKFQMNTYIDELKGKTGLVDDQVTGILVHAVDEERHKEFKSLTKDNIKIRDNTIHIELIRIDVSAEEIIAQIKDMILTYSK